MSGVLQVVATPLGNLEDLSPRGRRALAEADAIAAEDTRRTGGLLQKLGLPRKPLLSYFAPREKQKARAILERLRRGETVALVTDGGTPGISDPGALLVAEAHREGIRVEPIPGPSAAAMALSVSAVGGERFAFEGFLPPRAAARRRRLEELASEERTLVFYESPHRIAALLADMVEILGPARIGTIVREGTKLHEEIVEGSLEELAGRFPERTIGEIALVVEGAREPEERAFIDPETALAHLVGLGESPERAARTVAEWTGLPRNRLTRLAREKNRPPP